VSTAQPERATLRTCRLAIERALLLGGAVRGRVRAVTEMILHAEVQSGEGIAWLLDDPERLAASPRLTAPRDTDGTLVVDCGGQPSLAVAPELADMVTARAARDGRAVLVARDVERPELLAGITAITPRRGFASVATSISSALADALGGPPTARAPHAGDALVVAALAPGAPGAGDEDVASLAGSPVIALAVRNDLWLDPESWERLQTIADGALMPESERSQLDTGVLPPGVDENTLL
jgi:hypothetical protein